MTQQTARRSKARENKVLVSEGCSGRALCSVRLRRWVACFPLAAVLAGPGCAEPPPAVQVQSLRELGLIPDPPGTGGRDSGMSALFDGHSVWLFGDTFFTEPARDGFRWRSSSWSWTDDLDPSDGLSGWRHALDDQGKPIQAVPHTPEEQAFNEAHNGDPCAAGRGCGERRTPWPAGAFVVDPDSGNALVFYNPMETEPTSAFTFRSLGTSLALWRSVAAPAERSEVSSGVGPQRLFGPDEPLWGAGALVEQGLLYVYACSNTGHGSGCLLARVPSRQALDRRAWRFWSGSTFSEEARAAAPVFEGAPYVSVSFNPYVGQYLAWYMPPLSDRILVRSAPRPEGPWSRPVEAGRGQPSLDPNNWDYALVAHPELDRAGGRIVTLSYYRPGVFLDGTIHAVEVTLD